MGRGILSQKLQIMILNSGTIIHFLRLEESHEEHRKTNDENSHHCHSVKNWTEYYTLPEYNNLCSDIFYDEDSNLLYCVQE